MWRRRFLEAERHPVCTRVCVCETWGGGECRAGAHALVGHPGDGQPAPRLRPHGRPRAHCLLPAPLCLHTIANARPAQGWMPPLRLGYCLGLCF